MDFSTARRCDLPELIALYRAAIQSMDAQGIPQWDEIYPDRRVIAEDISRGEMEVGRVGETIAVAFSLELCGEGDYEPANWRYPAPRFVVLHRLCVHPAFQGRGIAKEAMDHIEQSVLTRGIHAIRLDAFSRNPAALRLYESRGYEKAGTIQYRKGLFYLYEKRLS
ncbi:MAG: N-acetyltransferase [Clostridiales bacterium]|nr:N-acetyltransferase [Clostridiales bacterium]